MGGGPCRRGASRGVPAGRPRRRRARSMRSLVGGGPVCGEGVAERSSAVGPRAVGVGATPVVEGALGVGVLSPLSEQAARTKPRKRRAAAPFTGGLLQRIDDRDEGRAA